VAAGDAAVCFEKPSGMKNFAPKRAACGEGTLPSGNAFSKASYDRNQTPAILNMTI